MRRVVLNDVLVDAALDDRAPQTSNLREALAEQRQHGRHPYVLQYLVWLRVGLQVIDCFLGGLKADALDLLCIFRQLTW